MGHKLRYLSVLIIIGILLVIGCDNSSITPASNINIEEETSSERFFANTDSLNSLLDIAVDALRQRNTQNGFVHEFITERGYPVWDAHSVFYKKGKPIFRIPVQAANGQKITGFIEIVMDESQPLYYWIARGTRLKGMSREGLELLMWGYEQRVFGKTHTDEGARIVRKIADPKKGNVMLYKEEEVCWSTCAGNYCGDWQCEGGGGGSGSGFGGGFGSGFGGDGGYGGGGPHGGGSDSGGGGGGSGYPTPGDDDGSGDKACANYKARIPVGGCEGNGDGGNSRNTITNYPEVRYPENSDYAEKYPKLTEYLKNKLPKIADNKEIVDAILKYTDLSRTRIKEELQWGEGPIVEIKQLDNKCGKCDENTAGLFDGNENPNVLNLDIDVVNLLENTSNQVMGDAFSFWVGTIILHEYIHYGDYADGTDYPGEEGILFEDEAYGEKVTNENAAEILYSRE